jgi:hypothetical protein
MTGRSVLRVSRAAASFAVAMAVAVVAYANVAAESARAQGSPYNRNCGTARDGFATTNERWESTGPWHITMSYETARSIAKRVGPSEFQPPASHPRPAEVPCAVASAVAFAGANAWTTWHATGGWVSAAWAGYATGPSFGRFHCTGVSRSDGGVKETCTHRADRHAGRITVQFIVRRRPK